MLDSKPQLMRTAASVSLVCGLCHATGAMALGFGDIRLGSALNQPLNAQLDLVSLSDSERDSLSVRIASPDLFQRFGIERTGLADELNIRVDAGSGNRVTVHLTTHRPVREPFLRFLIEADTAQGRALREYTVLLDPPGSLPVTTAQSSAHAVPAQTASSNHAVSSAATNGPALRLRTYGPVVAGETLFKIAGSTQRSGTTRDQMQVAIYRDNPQAFNGNMNLLLRGAMLTIPEAARVRQIDEADALAVIHAQRRQFAAANAMPDKSQAAAAPQEAVAAESGPTTTAATLRLEAPPEATSRLARSAEGQAGFGRLVEPDYADFTPTPTPTPAVAETPEDSDAGQAVAVSTEMAGIAVAGAAESAAPAASTSDDGAGSLPGQTASGSQDRPQEKPTPLTALHEKDVAGVGGGMFSPRNLLLLLGLMVLGGATLLWRRRSQYEPVPLDFSAGDDDEPAYMGASSEDGEQETAVTQPPVTGVAPVQPDTVEPVQLQDADRQMKLGLFDEARQTLQQGLRQQPEHAGMQDKLIELDYLAGDMSGFARDVDRFEPSLAASGVRWAGIAAMGRVLLPDDPRFASTTGTVNSSPVPQPGQAGVIEPVQHPQTDAQPSLMDAHDEPRTIDHPHTDDSDAQAPNADRTSLAEALGRTPEIDDVDADSYLERSMVDGTEAQRSFSIDDDSVPESSEAPIAPSVDEDPRVTPQAAPRGLDLDIDKAGSAGYEWEASQVDVDGEREHDRGDDPGMAFDLDSGEAVKSDAPTSGSVSPIDASEFDMEGGDSESSAEAADPVEIRLDLARMYIDMEDHTVARELLQESLNEGSEEQRDTAQQLLAKIG